MYGVVIVLGLITLICWKLCTPLNAVPFRWGAAEDRIWSLVGQEATPYPPTHNEIDATNRILAPQNAVTQTPTTQITGDHATRTTPSMNTERMCRGPKSCTGFSLIHKHVSHKGFAVQKSIRHPRLQQHMAQIQKKRFCYTPANASYI